ncbi:hypothetical protein [Nocardia asteroides]|uniref:hypothetical protein n=1 Tax=Nocardia asteroides TaxID=1824 RepID=UPI001E4352ED|nr:hypothetical protein [Nocardia asteroides]UGT60498.1 hypothetical protein LTT61_25465 [Nocardia asteroides]
MTTGVGICMGSATSVTASVTAGQPQPSVRVRPTTVSFDSRGTAGIGAPGVARVGATAEISGSAANFADLTVDGEPLVVGGRLWTPAALVAAVVSDLLRAEPPRAGVVLAHPAVYGADEVARLTQALDLAGAGHVLPVPEPVAAAEWLECETGPLTAGFVLVYDLGATSLDLGIVRVGADWPDHPLVGTPVRSRDFGGEPLGALIAERAYRWPGAPGTRGLDTEGLRAEHIRASFPLVVDCLASSGIDRSEFTGILVVGGAARPPEVARTLGELGLPVLRGADPGHTIALGAARFAARTLAPPARRAEPVAHVGVLSSAALVSALAMSAATVFGGPAPQSAPGLDRFPGVEGQFGMGQGIARVPVAGAAPVAGGRAVPYAGGGAPIAFGGAVAAPVRVYGPPLTPVSRSGRGGDGAPRTVPSGGACANPARFTNSLLFLERFGFGLNGRGGIGPELGVVGLSSAGVVPPDGGAGSGGPAGGQAPAGVSADAAGTSGASPAGGPAGGGDSASDGSGSGGSPGGTSGGGDSGSADSVSGAGSDGPNGAGSGGDAGSDGSDGGAGDGSDGGASGSGGSGGGATGGGATGGGDSGSGGSGSGGSGGGGSGGGGSGGDASGGGASGGGASGGAGTGSNSNGGNSNGGRTGDGGSDGGSGGNGSGRDGSNGDSPSGSDSAGPGNGGSAKAGSGNGGSGKAGSGNGGSGKAGSGNGGSGKAGSGNGGSGKGGSGKGGGGGGSGGSNSGGSGGSRGGGSDR